MSPNPTWTRRNFVSTLGLTGAAAALAPRLSVSAAPSAPARPAPALAFTGHSSEDGSYDRIETHLVENNIWTPVEHHRLPAKAPQAFATHPSLPILYAAHSVDTHGNLPRGSVSAYAIKANGQHTLLSHEPMALSATDPTHLAVSPNGKTLMATSPSGGAYNFFTLEPDGRIQPTPFPLKQTGSGPHPLQFSASPHSAVFAPSGAAYATDLGADRLNHIAFHDGIPTVASRVSFDPGSGPAHIALHPSGKLLVVASSLRPGLTVIPIDALSGQLETPVQYATIATPGVGPIAFNPKGDRLQVITGSASGSHLHSTLSTFRFSPVTGRLKLVDRKSDVLTFLPSPVSLNAHQLRNAPFRGANLRTISIASMPLSRA